MPDATTLSESARRVMLAMPDQPGEAITRHELRDRTKFTDSDLLAALSELVDRQWVDHTGYPGSPSGDTWRITPLGQSTGLHKPADPALSRTSEGTIILRPPRDQGLTRALGIAVLLYVLLWGALLMLGWKWVAIILILFVGVWIGLALNYLNRWTQVARLTPTTLLTRTWNGRSVMTPRESIAQIAFVHVHYGGTGRGATTLPYLLFLNAQGHCLSWLLTEDIPTDSQKAFVRHCGVPLRDLRGEKRSPRQLKRAFPDTTAGKQAAKTLAALGAVVLGLALTVLLLIAAGTFV